MNGTALLISGVIVVLAVIVVVFLVISSFRSPPDPPPPADPPPTTRTTTPRQPIQTFRARPPQQRVPIQTITPSPGPRAGIQTVVASRVDRPLPAHARCGWCLSLITHCIAEGRGPAVRCNSRGCDGLSCQTCANEQHQQCPGICGGTLN